MLSEVRYGTFANYSPRGQSELSKQSKRICGRIKAGDLALIDSFVQFLNSNPTTVLAEFFTAETTLVPIPGSAPVSPGGLWTPKLICERLVYNGRGREILPCLQRTVAVPKSATAGPGNRPTIQTHYDSMSATIGLFVPTRITLVDDVLTRGRTSFAAARRVKEALPNAELRVFAVIRTQGLIPEITTIRDPSIGRILLMQNGTDVDRDP